jgi:phosphoglucosamine mutase
MAVDEMGFSVTRTKVGDIYVSEELENGGDFGGEPSGAWVFPHSSLCPDGIYAAAQMVVIASQQKLSRFVDSIADYPLLRGSFPSKGMLLPNLEEKLKALKPSSVTNIDGVRLTFEDGWLLVRPSGTEPRIRVTAQAKSQQRANELYDSAIKTLKEC